MSGQTHKPTIPRWSQQNRLEDPSNLRDLDIGSDFHFIPVVYPRPGQPRFHPKPRFGMTAGCSSRSMREARWVGKLIQTLQVISGW